MRWWGWGDPLHPPGLPAHALRYLADTVGVSPEPRPPVALERVALEPPAIPASTLHDLREIVGTEHARDDHLERVVHAAGKGYPDLVRLRAGAPEGAPDAVLYPGSHDELRALLAACAERSLAVVAFGGGTSVVGGVEPLRGSHRGVVALDTRRLARVLELDECSLTVRVQAGARARALEQWLMGRGLTLGHFPQSFEYVSLGGCAATRSAGQASTGYGRFERMVHGLRMVAPAGDIDLPAHPASAAGPGLRELLVGSEGTLGVIHELSLRVRPAPAARVYEGVFFQGFQDGVHAFRELAQRRAAPDVARLSDEEETRMSLALAGSGGAKGRLGRAYLGARGYASGCLAILGFEGEREEVGKRRARAREVVRRLGGLPVGRSPGHAWHAARFSAPYLRDELLTHGVMVETLETATQWSNLLPLYQRVTDAISRSLLACGTPGVVMCHVSHLYETGASLYYTFFARQLEGEELGQWQAVKAAACEAIVTGGGTITHHHAIGRDHAGWLERARPARDHESGQAARGRQLTRGRRSHARTAFLRADSVPMPDSVPTRGRVRRRTASGHGPARCVKGLMQRERAAQHNRAGVAGVRAGLSRDDQLGVVGGGARQRTAAFHPAAGADRGSAAERRRARRGVVQPDRVEEAVRGRQALGGYVEGAAAAVG
jgi:alkyldihydroxyacetonephosphate synthase